MHILEINNINGLRDVKIKLLAATGESRREGIK